MIRLGLRLAVAGGREAMARLALIAIAVAIGVGLLLTTLGSINAFGDQNARFAWLETGYVQPAAPVGAPSEDPSLPADPLWWRLRADYFHGIRIGRVDVAATGPQSPVPPGIPALPGTGEFYASPALAELLRDTPGAQLGDRFPGTQVGTIGPEALPGPDSLIIIVGRDAAELAEEGAQQVTQISTTRPTECAAECALGVGTNDNGMTLVLSVVAAALLFPVLIFIGGATRLSAARREQRFAAMRLVGATPRQVSRLAIVESGVATVVGVAAGFGVFYAIRPAIGRIRFNDDRFFVSDVTLSVTNVILVAVGVPIGAAVAARIALRRVNISPLGVTRRVTPRPPRLWRVVPLVAGIAYLSCLAFFSSIGESTNSTTQAVAYLVGIFLVMIGLLTAGPGLTMLGARLIARRTGRPAGLIAARRLSDNPQAAFRAISGVVLAVFVGSVAIGAVGTIVAYNVGAAGDSVTSTATVIYPVWSHESDAPITSISDGAMNQLTSVGGVGGVASIHAQRVGRDVVSFVSCAEIADTPALGHCPDGADTVIVRPRFGGPVIDSSTPMADTTWPAADVTAEALAMLPIDMIVVTTDGSRAAVEETRTVLEDIHPATFPPQTLSELKASNSQQINNYRQLANVVLFASLPIAGCSLAVSVAGGLSERRRPFSLLRLTGVPLAMLRRVVIIETAVPLLISAVVAAGVGMLTAALFLRAQLDYTLQPPDLSYCLLIAGGIVASLAIIATTLPLLRQTTGPDAARND